MYYFVRKVHPTSPTDPRPTRWYLIGHGISSLAWVATLACVVLVVIKSQPFAGDKDKESGLQRCGRGDKCYPATHNAQINTHAKVNTAAVSIIM